MKYLFVTGMFRSGTTLLARALNAHGEVGLASDPYLEFLKFIRNKSCDPAGPFEDNFL